MKLTKAVITAAGRKQRTLPLQALIDRDGVERSVLGILLEEVVRARIEEVCIVVCPGDEAEYAKVAGDHGGRIRFVHQQEALGYGHAVYCAKDFTGQDPFLHLVGDHMYVSRSERGCAEQLVEVAAQEACAVSLVQATRENLLARFGAVAGPVLAGRPGAYRVDTVIEKPTPTEAEQRLVVAGLRAGHYLCFFGMHVLTPAVMDLLGTMLAGGDPRQVTLSMALAEAAGREKYLAVETAGRRYDLGARYGLLAAQMALALSGQDRNEVLALLVELLALRDAESSAR